MKVVFYFLIVSLLFSMCDEKTTVEGYLQLFGSEPFPKMAVITEEHGRLFLDLNPEKRDSLWANQKGAIRITGEIYENEWLGRPQSFISLEEWEWIDDPD